MGQYNRPSQHDKAERKIFDGGKWFEQSVLKPRANKYVSISIGDNGTFHVPKIALRFLSSYCSLVALFFGSPFALANQRDHIAPLEQGHIQTFSKWLYETFDLKSDDGEPLRPMASKFRASGSCRYLAKREIQLKQHCS